MTQHFNIKYLEELTPQRFKQAIKHQKELRNFEALLTQYNKK